MTTILLILAGVLCWILLLAYVASLIYRGMYWLIERLEEILP